MTSSAASVVSVSSATGPRAERDNAAVLVASASAPYRQAQITVGADKTFHTRDCVNELRAFAATPHVAQNINPRHPTSAIDGRTVRHAGYAVSQRVRKRIEEIFG